jgi:hypothetical protein
MSSGMIHGMGLQLIAHTIQRSVDDTKHTTHTIQRCMKHTIQQHMVSLPGLGAHENDMSVGKPCNIRHEVFQRVTKVGRVETVFVDRKHVLLVH